MRIKEDLINKEVLDGGAELIGKVAVSYTHLTLPTIRLV